MDLGHLLELGRKHGQHHHQQSRHSHRQRRQREGVVAVRVPGHHEHQLPRCAGRQRRSLFRGEYRGVGSRVAEVLKRTDRTVQPYSAPTWEIRG